MLAVTEMPTPESVDAADAGAVIITIGSVLTVITGVVAVACWLFASVSVTVRAQPEDDDVREKLNTLVVWAE